MILEEIKQAVQDGKTVCWSTEDYKVILDSLGRYLIHYYCNDSCIGLTWQDGVTMNGLEEHFFILE